MCVQSQVGQFLRHTPVVLKKLWVNIYPKNGKICYWSSPIEVIKYDIENV